MEKNRRRKIRGIAAPVLVRDVPVGVGLAVLAKGRTDLELHPFVEEELPVLPDVGPPLGGNGKLIEYGLHRTHRLTVSAVNTSRWIDIIHLLLNKNLDTLVHQEKELKEEVYLRHQEINQYKESLRSFIRTSRDKEIGIIFL